MDDTNESEYKPLTVDYLKDLSENRELRKKKQEAASKNAKKGSPDTAENQSDEIAPDVTLADGELLPQYYGKCPGYLLGRPLEDLDPYYREKGEPTFCVATERFSSVYIYRFTASRACFILSPFNPIRKAAVRIAVNQFFDYFVMMTIVANCVFLALDSEIVESEYVFTAIYTLEMMIKILARGVILQKFTYLRDGWNWLDFIVVILAWVTIMITALSSGQTHLNLSGLRTFRVIRALKSFTIVPGLKTIVNALLQSLKPLAEVMVIMLFLVVVISLIALQAYQGVLKRKCVSIPPANNRLTPEQFNDYVQNPNNWNPVDGELQVCGNASSSGLCPDGYICMQDVGDNPNHGFTNFDHFGWAMLTSFQLLTLDFWENVYNMIIRAEGAWNVLFFFMCVVLGPFYLLNLLLAVVTLAYSKEHEKQTKLREMREKAKENSRRRNKRRRLLAELAKNKDVTSGRNVSDVVEQKIQEDRDRNENGLVIPNLTNGDISPRSARNSEISGKNEDSVRSQIVTNNSASVLRRQQMTNLQKDTSIESSESANSVGEWQQWITRKYEAFHGICCSWTCHPKFNRFQDFMLKIVEHKIFEGFVVLSIVTNTVFLALDHHNINETFENVLVIGNYVFTGIFCVEALMKILALGCLKYIKNPWNLFDFSIVIISLLEFALRSSSDESSSALSVLRSLRLMRVFRLARIWQTMRKLMSIILKSLSAVVYLTVVLFMVLFIFAVVGKQLYSDAYKSSASKFTDNEIPRWNFVDFYHSFLLVWRVMCGEWIEPLHDCMVIADSASCIPIFLLMIFIGNFLVLNLFTAILLEAFNVDNLKSKQADEKKTKLKRGVSRFKKKILRKSQSRKNLNENGSTSNDDNNANDCEPENSGENETENCSDQKSPDLDMSDANLRRRSTSIANMFALNQASGKRRSFTSKKSISDENPILENSIIDIPASTESSPRAIRMQSRRTTLTKQSRVSESNLSVYENGSASSKNNNDTNTPEASVIHGLDSISAGVASKKVTFAVSGNSKVYPRRRLESGEESEDGEEKVISSFCCARCCTPYKAREENNDETSSVVAEEDQNSSSEVDPDPESAPESDNSPPACFPEWCRCCGSPKDNKLWQKWTKFRTVVFRLVKHRIFEWLILVVILASTVSLALEDITLKQDPERARILGILEYVFTSIFTAEMVLKWIGIGWRKYFTNWWCVIDFVIVVISWIGIGASTGEEVDSLKAFRTLRALRPLRAISRWQGMKVVVNALVYCIPSIANVLCVCMLLWLVFSIIGVQQFKGRFYRCQDSNGEISNYTIVPNKTICVQQNDTWSTPRINFDNVFNGMIALFQVATFEGWIEVMADASDAREVDQQPRREANPYSYVFFFFFVLIGSFFILNLIVGVIIESFQNLRKQTDSTTAVEAFLTDSQKNFYKTMRTMLNRKPKKTIPPPDNRTQLKVFKLVTHSKFEVVVFTVIVLNMVTLAMEHYKMSDTWITVLRYVDISFTVTFTLEAFLKILGTRFYYFRDPFNVFDFVVVMLSITGFILEELLTFLVSPTLLRVVRVFRVFRVLRVIRAARGIRRLILTLMISLPALFNIAVLLGVFMVIFAILGMSFFMEVKLRGALNDVVNFQTFGNSMMLLFRLMTSAGWNDVLDPLMNDTDCIAEECGNYYFAIAYFVAYIFLVFLVIVNMYIAIILENFDDIFQQEESGVGQDDFEFFYVVWGRYDPKASQFVSLGKLSNLLHSLHPPFQLAKPNEIKIAALNLPIVNVDKVHCLDVLFALVGRIMGEVDIPDEMKQEAEARLLKSFPNRMALKSETTTLVLRQRMKAAKTIQGAWRDFTKRVRASGDDLFSQSLMESNTPPASRITSPIKETNDDDMPDRVKSTSAEIYIANEINLIQGDQYAGKSGSDKNNLSPNLPLKEDVSQNADYSDMQLESMLENSDQPVGDSDPKTTLHSSPGENTNSNVVTNLANLETYNKVDSKNEAKIVRVASAGKRKSSLPVIREEKPTAPPSENRIPVVNNYIRANSMELVQINREEANSSPTTPNVDSSFRYSEQSSLNLTDKLFHTVLPRITSHSSPARQIRTRSESLDILSKENESKPVPGKDLKFIPHTGKFKTRTKKAESSQALISQPRIDETTGNEGLEYDQSMVIANDTIAIANDAIVPQSASQNKLR